MNYDFEINDAHHQVLEEIPQPHKVPVTFLDKNNQPLACGVAILPLLLGVGVFWPSSPLTASKRLALAKRVTLPSGESMSLRTLKPCSGCLHRYDFWVNMP